MENTPQSNENINSDLNVELASDQESTFEVNELFVSRTNKQSIIQSGNNVFVRVSGYDKKELIQRPHNVIRHPDMPKAVFKLLWNEIKEDHVFCGYIKNRSKNGNYYWVLAIIFSTQDSYISVRLKPTSDMLSTVKDLYAQVLKYEQESGTDAALKILNEKINSLGFANYNEFMMHALRRELFSRDEKLSFKQNKAHVIEKSATSIERSFTEIYELLMDVSNNFRQASHNPLYFDKLKNNCEKGSTAVSEVFTKLESLSINMSIAAHKLGKEGGTLSVVSSAFQKTAELVIKGFESFQQMSDKIVKDFDSVLFSVLCSRAQIEMLAFQINEILSDLRNGKLNNLSEQKEILKETIILSNEIQKLFFKNTKIQESFLNEIIKLEKNTNNLKGLITRLELIRTGGKLEGSRTPVVAEVFLPFIKDMENFIQSVSTPVNDIVEDVEKTSTSFDEIFTTVKMLEYSVVEVNNLLGYVSKNLISDAA